MIGFELQRKNMVESQVRPSDVTDRRVLRAMQDIAREAFMPESLRATAYMDQDLRLPALPEAQTPGDGRANNRLRRWLLAPRLVARMIQHLEIDEGESVMEVGAATGYSAAILSRMARKVVALESDEGLAAGALQALTAAGAGNVEVVCGPLTEGVPGKAPFAAILISGSVSQVPPALLDQLLDGGRLTVVETRFGVGRLMQWRRTGRTYGSRAIMDVSAPELPGMAAKRGFVF